MRDWSCERDTEEHWRNAGRWAQEMRASDEEEEEKGDQRREPEGKWTERMTEAEGW
jgi:hypothetical protein